jgi:hypothetical protein
MNSYTVCSLFNFVGLINKGLQQKCATFLNSFCRFIGGAQSSALVYKPKCGGGVAGSQQMNAAVRKEPKQTLLDLTPNLTYDLSISIQMIDL